MERRIITSGDGSRTLFVPALNEHYHSIHGAIGESMHIFIREGLHHCNAKEVSILEAGFGTGLNAYLSLLDASANQRNIRYHTLEKYPLAPTEYEALDYPSQLREDHPELFLQLHTAPWGENHRITPYFTLYKQLCDFRETDFTEIFDLVYYDAFAPEVQPQLWEETTLEHFSRALKPGGILVTYCVKGIVKQALRRLGLKVRRLPGPPGKREMLRAEKPLPL